MRSRFAFASLSALAAGLAIGPAHGQAFQGTPVVQSGNVTFARTTPGAETITVNSAQSVVNWTVTAAPDAAGNIDFLPQAASATYAGGAALTGNYTILNRILPGNAANRVAFNGQVTSTLGGVRGGNVWFYSPGGIIVGDTGRFDVGSLLLTTLDPVRDAGGNFVNGAGQTVFAAGAPGSIVNILSGAQINASVGTATTGNYVALVAPLVYQAGTVTVNGSAAYVAAEAATMTINQGLFDIVVTTGSTDNGFPLQHAGTTTGPASTGTGDNQRIYLVSVPKNDAITIAIAPTARLGFTPATAAGVENGRIVLSAGLGITRFATNPTEDNFGGGTILPGIANLAISGGTFTSSVQGYARNSASIASLVATPSFSGNVSLRGEATSEVGARISGQTLTIGGNLTIASGTLFPITGTPLTGGTASLYAENGGAVSVAGSATVSSQQTLTFAANNLAPTTAGTSTILARTGGTVDVMGATVVDSTISTNGDVVTGGSAIVSALNTGVVTLRGSATVRANGTLTNNALAAGTATGGTATVNADAGGTISVAGLLTASAVATGGSSAVAGRSGSNAAGGNLFVSATGPGSRVILNGVSGSVDGTASIANSNGAGSGFGRGGAASISQSDTGSVAITGNVALTGNGAGGNSTAATIAGGAGTGGDVRFVANAGTTGATGTVTLTASGSGGANTVGGAGGAGGAGTGGIANVGAGLGATTIGGGAVLTASGVGGISSNGGGTGGAGQGGQALLGTVDSGRISVAGALVATATGMGGQKIGTGTGGAGGAGRGGVAQVFANPSPNSTTGAGGTIGLATATLDATGIAGANGSSAGANGTATGGQALFGTTRGALTATNVSLIARAIGPGAQGVGTSAATAQGGTVNVAAEGGATLTVTTLAANADAFGSAARIAGGTGGAGTGGTITVAANAGSTARIGNISASSRGTGGATIEGSIGGAGTGGTINLSAGANGQLLVTNSLDIAAIGVGGTMSNAAGGTGGTGTGGNTRLLATAIGGVVDVTGTTSLSAFGVGGDVPGAVGTGGVGRGGLAILRTDGGTVNLRGDASLDAGGSGGFAPIGGAGFGGRNATLTQGAYINAAGGRIAIAGEVELDASGTGETGRTGAGGAGTGGTANITAQTSATVPGGSTIALNRITIEAEGSGGRGGRSASGGAAFGGSALVTGAAGNGVVSGTELAIDVSGSGGAGGDGAAGAGGGAGGAADGGSAQIGTLSGATLATYTGSATFGGVTALAVGIGGVGGAGASGAGSGGAGGSGSGGNASLVSRGSLVQADSVNLLATGLGGSGGAVAGTVSGLAGRGAGGTTGVIVTPHATSNAPGSAVLGTVLATSDGVNGTGIGPAPQSAFGSYTFTVQGGTATIGSIAATAAGDVQRVDQITAFVAGAAGQQQVSYSQFRDRVSDLDVSENGTLSVTGSVSLASGGDIALITGAGSRIAIAGDLGASAAGAFVAADQILTPIPDDGPMNGGQYGTLPGAPTSDRGAPGTLAARSIGLTTPGSITIRTALASATGLSIASPVAATLGDLAAAGDLGVTAPTVSAGTVISDADVELTATAGLLAAGGVRAAGDADLTSAGDLSAERVSAGNSVTLTAGGDIALAGADAGIVDPAPAGGGSAYGILLDAGGSVTVAGTIQAGTDAGILARTGTISTGDILTDGSIVLLSDRAITTGALDGLIDTGAGGEAIVFLGGTGNLATLGVDLDPALLVDRTTTAFGNGDITVRGGVEARNFDVATTGNVTAQGAIEAARRIVIEAGGTAAFQANASADRVRVVSSDIVIGQAGSLGSPATSAIELVALSGTGPIVFGGAPADAGGYRLDRGEIATLGANRIALSVASNGRGAGDLTLAGFDVAGTNANTSGLYGGNAQFTVSSPGTIRVTGALRLNQAGGDNLLSLSTPGRLEVVTDTGSLGIFAGEAGGGALTGRLALAGSTIAVASQAALAQLAGEGTAASRAALVNAVAPVARPEGFLEAAATNATASDGIFVQNSGTGSTAAGFTVGGGGFTIVSTAPATSAGLEAVVNGRQATDGGFRINGDVRQAVTVQTAPGAAGLALANSAVNGCLFAATSCAPVVTPPPVEPPPVTPPPVEPPPVTPPPVEPPPVTPPPVEPPPVVPPPVDPVPGVPAPVVEAPGDISAAVRGVVDGPLSAVADATSPTSVPDVRIQALVDTSRFDAISFIEEPVTGGGNAALSGDDGLGLAGSVSVEPTIDEGVTGIGADRDDDRRDDARRREKQQ